MSDFLPYSRPVISEADIAAVVDVLRSPMISQGSVLPAFESAFAKKVGARFGVGYSSGTAALHGMVAVAGIGPGDEVILPPLTFVSTANVVRYCGATPVFADIDPQTYTLDPAAVAAALTPRTKAIIAVDYAGQPCEYTALREIAKDTGILLLSDAAHAPGATYHDRLLGSSLTDLAAFSFNPVKNMTAAEGGMVTTDNPEYAARLRQFRLHGITRAPERLERLSEGGWYFEQQVLGFNYKLSELHAALGLSQLARLDAFNDHRRQLAAFYDTALADLPLLLPVQAEGRVSTRHLYPVQVLTSAPHDRATLFAFLRRQGLGVQVHYIPVPHHPDYIRFGYRLADYPNTAQFYARALSLPLHPAMTLVDAERVVKALQTFFAMDAAALRRGTSA